MIKNNDVNHIFLYYASGNCNLVYAIIRKRNVFHQLANLPTDSTSIQKALQKKKKSPDAPSRTNSQETVSMEGSRPAVPAEPGTLKASLVAMPGNTLLYCSGTYSLKRKKDSRLYYIFSVAELLYILFFRYW